MTSKPTTTVSALDRVLTVAAVLAIPALLMALWQGSAHLREQFNQWKVARTRSTLADSLSIGYTGGASFGETAAPTMTVIEFTDYECPACRATQPAIDRLLREWDGGRLIIMHYPLEDIHPSARHAARLAICAEELGRFDQTHTRLMSWPNLGDTASTTKMLVDSVGLDQSMLQGCLTSDRPDRRIVRDRALASRFGVAGTPTFISPTGERIGLGGLSQLAASHE